MTEGDVLALSAIIDWSGNSFSPWLLCFRYACRSACLFLSEVYGDVSVPYV